MMFRSAHKRLLALAGSALSLLLCACSYGAYYLQFTQDSPDERASSITSLTDDDVPNIGTESRYSFVVIADPHFGASKSRSDDRFLAWFASQLAAEDTTLRPRFMANVGDTLNNGLDEEADDYEAFCNKVRQAAADSPLADTDFKIYTVLGNHDLYNNGWSVWKKRVYPHTSYYTFSVQAGSSEAFSFYFLDSGNGSLGDSQLNNLIKNLQADPRPKIVFSHYAVYAGDILYFTTQDTMERNLLIDAYAKNNVKYVFEGHDHPDHLYSFPTFSERAVPSLLYKSACCLVTVDEETATVTSQKIEF